MNLYVQKQLSASATPAGVSLTADRLHGQAAAVALVAPPRVRGSTVTRSPLPTVLAGVGLVSVLVLMARGAK